MCRRLAGAFALACAVLAAPAAWTEPHDARRIVEEVTSHMLGVIAHHRDELRADPGRIHALIDEHLIPHLDFDRMSRLVLGKYWRQASEQQQQTFIEQFRRLLVRTYGTALIEYSGEQIHYLPSRPGSQADRVVVRTSVEQAGGFPIPIHYSMASSNGTWKVYDITVDGVSLVMNYRTSFSSEIRTHGIDGLIAALEQRNTGTAQ